MSLLQYFRLVDVQARMSLKADASRLWLGYVWWILEPMLYVGVFYVVFDLILDRKKADLVVFLMCGKFPFIWFARSLNQSANSIVGASGLIGRVNITKSLFPMAVVQQNFYKQLAVFAFLLGFVAFKGFAPDIGWLWLLPIIAAQYVLIMACSLAGAILVCFIRDLALAISLITTFLLFTSGIFWDVRDLGNPELTDLILLVNPLAFLIDAYRQVIMHDAMPDLPGLAQLTVVFALAAAGLFVYLDKASQQLALKALS